MSHILGNMKLKLDFLNEEAAKLAISFSMGVFRIEEHDADVRFSVKVWEKILGWGAENFYRKYAPFLQEVTQGVV